MNTTLSWLKFAWCIKFEARRILDAIILSSIEIHVEWKQAGKSWTKRDGSGIRSFSTVCCMSRRQFHVQTCICISIKKTKTKSEWKTEEKQQQSYYYFHGIACKIDTRGGATTRHKILYYRINHFTKMGDFFRLLLLCNLHTGAISFRLYDRLSLSLTSSLTAALKNGSICVRLCDEKLNIDYLRLQLQKLQFYSSIQRGCNSDKNILWVLRSLFQVKKLKKIF